MNGHAAWRPAEHPAKVMTAYSVFRRSPKRLSLQGSRDDQRDTACARRRRGLRRLQHLRAGEHHGCPVEILLKGATSNGNDASIALAEKVVGTEDGFAQMMNTYAKQLSMTRHQPPTAPACRPGTAYTHRRADRCWRAR